MQSISSPAELRQQRVEIQAVGGGQSPENQEQVAVAEESARLYIEEAHDVFELDEALALEVDLLGGEALRGEAGSVEYVLDLGGPVFFGCEVGGGEQLVAALEALHAEKRVVLGLVHGEELLAGLEIELKSLALQRLH